MTQLDDAGWPRITHPLDGNPPPEYVPPLWTAEHVGVRILEAYKAMTLLPPMKLPKLSATAWPASEDDPEVYKELSVDELARRSHKPARLTPRELSLIDTVNQWIWTMHGAGRDVSVVSSWAYARAREEGKGWRPVIELRWLAERLNRDGVVVF